jgi:hypothetical protein
LRKRSDLLRQITKADVLAVADYGVTLLGECAVCDLLKIVDDRHDRRAAPIVSQ